MGNNEEFDKNSICIANVDCSNPPENKIIIGNAYRGANFNRKF